MLYKMANINDWSVVEKVFRSGKQGIAGLIKTKTSPSSRFVFKVSQNFDFVIEHEYKIMIILAELRQYCPHFCLSPELLLCPVESKLKKYKNPFDIISRPVFKFVLIEEFVPGPKLGSYIDNKKSLPAVFSAVKQLMMGIALSHDFRFTHYDLHTDNIILNRCNTEKVMLYILDDIHTYAIPTHGYCPKIIDYGFSYVKGLDGTQLSTSFFHTDIGYTNDRFDWLCDAKLFLVSVAYQISNVYGSSSEARRFDNCIKNMFNGLSLDWECGWDDYEGQSVLDLLMEHLEEETRVDTFLFRKHTVDALEIMQAMIDMPLKPNDYEDMLISYNMFLKEFKHIEDKIENTSHLLCVLKAIVESARKIKDDYRNKETRKQAITTFKNDIFEVVTSLAKFCTIKDIHYEKMLCALYSFSECMCGFYFKEMGKRYMHKIGEYDNIPVKNIIDVLNVLHCNFEDSHIYSQETIVVVCDRMSRKMTEFTINKKEAQMLNSQEYWMKSNTLYNIYKNKFSTDSDINYSDFSDEDHLPIDSF